MAVDPAGNSTTETYTVIISAPIVTNSVGGSGGPGAYSQTSSASPIVSPSYQSSLTTSTPPSIQTLLTQILIAKNPITPVRPSAPILPPVSANFISGLSQTTQTVRPLPVYEVKNRITNYICPKVVQVWEADSLRATDIPDQFSDDISALIMFRALGKDEETQ
jgi:hypothetical protein